ncbi:hypothetical protein [Anatilimnocola floriformis]|uniref:hypothetical protein n=1 Tax=Anatilimnocola floriformis TaxID=2948575 RepID=UPI0020C261BA|nr:hypothetical protein [Anatilimnocola floriformis]
MTRVGLVCEFDEVFEHFLVESGCLPAATVAEAWQARWRGPQWMGAVSLSSRMLSVREASAVLQLQASTGETFGACANQLDLLTLPQIAELTLLAYWQRRSLSECLIQDQGVAERGLADLQHILTSIIRNAQEPKAAPQCSAIACS